MKKKKNVNEFRHARDMIGHTFIINEKSWMPKLKNVTYHDVSFVVDGAKVVFIMNPDDDDTYTYIVRDAYFIEHYAAGRTNRKRFNTIDEYCEYVQLEGILQEYTQMTPVQKMQVHGEPDFADFVIEVADQYGQRTTFTSSKSACIRERQSVWQTELGFKHSVYLSPDRAFDRIKTHPFKTNMMVLGIDARGMEPEEALTASRTLAHYLYGENLATFETLKTHYTENAALVSFRCNFDTITLAHVVKFYDLGFRIGRSDTDGSL